MDDPIQNILNLPDPSYTDLRRFPKDAIIQAFLEIKRGFSSESVRIKQIELEIKKLDHSLEIKKIEADVSKRMLDYSNYEENKYGPMAASNVSTAVSNVMGVPMTISKDLEEATYLEQRVDLALEQGLRWNSQNKRPELNSTVLRKIEIWEKALESGRQANPEDYITLTYEEIVSNHGKGSEAFVVGLCETMEESLGIKKTSKYLKTRFKRNVAKLFSVETPTHPPLTSVDHAIELVKRFWGTGLSKDDTNDLVAKLSQRIDNVGGLERLTPRNLKGLSTVDLLPIALSFPEGRHPQTLLKDLCWSEQYDEEINDLIETYRSEVGK